MASPSAASATSTRGAVRRFTCDELLRMVAAGVIREDEPLELLAGELVVMSPQGPLHSGTIAKLVPRLHAVYGDRFVVRPQLPLAASDHDLPEPDLAVVRPEPGGHMHRHPAGDEAVLVVEVAQSSQSHDRAKATVYARAGVPVYWLLDLAAGRLEVAEHPGSDGYGRTTVLGSIEDVLLPETDVVWSVRTLLP